MKLGRQDVHTDHTNLETRGHSSNTEASHVNQYFTGHPDVAMQAACRTCPRSKAHLRDRILSMSLMWETCCGEGRHLDQ
jgi:hypothetical protein